MTDTEETLRTDKGRGVRRVVNLHPSVNIGPTQIETDPAAIYAVLDEIFRRYVKGTKRRGTSLYNFYSRNHNSFFDAQSSVEYRLLKEPGEGYDSPESGAHSYVLSTDRIATDFFEETLSDLAVRILKRKGVSNVEIAIHTAYVTLWRVPRKVKPT